MQQVHEQQQTPVHLDGDDLFMAQSITNLCGGQCAQCAQLQDSREAAAVDMSAQAAGGTLMSAEP